ncbi:rhodanese-like domain-containing protein [Rhodoferax sp.]|uniref:rhodanese-like domain-containing protein n=1 Tax=Rhodoferax sp. TaxID=50421 RepID=UPI00262B2054|nr:rhodanese-like domain-containing protein [Rhodoferax sp.]MDD2811768.1 rhodanese-like domain-containing protein [Rhodoferax sp.]MDD4945232.1 rhodanese-like domain-containing protein [Rhodoferax sp.]MDD5481250.1 rhodanese-like domain-containing protein [Rhodoferax sp.]
MNKRSTLKLMSALALSVGLAMPVLAADTPATLKGTTLVSAAEVKTLLGKGVPVIDTRVAAEFAEKTILGAKNVPYKEKSAKDVNFDPAQDSFDLTKLPTDKAAPVVFFCNSGSCWKSYKASVAAIKAGYSKVQWFRGGMPEWVAAGLPTQ